MLRSWGDCGRNSVNVTLLRSGAFRSRNWWEELNVTVQIAEIVDLQTYQSQQILNVFHFLDEDGVADIATLASTYISDVLPLMQPIQSTSLQHSEVRYRRVYPDASLMHSTTTGLPVAGSYNTGDLLPSFYAGSVKWNLGDTTVLSGGFTGHIKRGGARVGGQMEGMVDSAGYNSPVTLAYRAWIEELLLPGTGPWELVVCSFLIGNHIPHGPARARSSTVTSYCPVVSGSDPSPSTQNSRKVLRGRSF